MAKFLLSRGADPTIAATNGCTALDLATLVEETDTELLRMLAKKTVQDAPPALEIPDIKKGKAFMSRSKSMANLTPSNNGRQQESKSGFRAWLERVSSRFRRVKPDAPSPVSINVTPAEPSVNGTLRIESLETTRLSVVEENENDHAKKEPEDLNGGTVFTMGFSAVTQDLSSYTLLPTMSGGGGRAGNSSAALLMQGPSSSSSRRMGNMPKGAHGRDAIKTDWNSPVPSVKSGVGKKKASKGDKSGGMVR